jgi:limonene 1,2-monooxygenase
MKSYELFARYVMPHFQRSAATLVRSNTWIRDNRRRILGNNVEAVRRAFTDTGRTVPDEYRYLTVGAQDVDPLAEE